MINKYLLDTNILIYYFNDGPEVQSNEMREFLRLLNSVSLTESVLDSAAQIRRDYRLKLGDGVIAACALVEGCVLVTRNAKDFKRVNGLTILNPFD
ncbi:MAG: type II toxin-antitoxin system VapC family toxin [Oscillatoriales cyanobacterium]|nr:MAG: type II toxin-antitoxin system VapC family toxin [Oscillatoriales cyanobacterium]